MADLRLAIRVLQSTPVVTGVAILSLALGIGANTAIFSIGDSLLLRALPVERPDGLALLVSNPAVTTGFSSWSNPMWEQIRDRRSRMIVSRDCWLGIVLAVSTALCCVGGSAPTTHSIRGTRHSADVDRLETDGGHPRTTNGANGEALGWP